MPFFNDVSKRIVDSLSALGVYYNVLTTAVGVISIVVLFLSYQMKTRGKILATYIGAAAGWMLYFILQGDLTSAMMNVIGIIRSVIFMQREKHKWANSVFWLFFFIAVMVGCILLTFSSWKDIFPLLGTVLGTVSFFVLSETLLRFLNIGTYCMWIGNSISKGYVVAMISDAFALISCIISIIRYRNKGEEKNKLSTDTKQ
ncbi:MAG: YgjV family protein [Clostridia bacterium]|nr:YgjV family protein [Clostridia bacterium]